MAAHPGAPDARPESSAAGPGRGGTISVVTHQARPAIDAALRRAAFTILLAALAARSDARPVLFPATPLGPAEWRDERDTAPYLAAWKASAARLAGAMHVAGTANQAAYDVRHYDLDLTFDPLAALVSGTVRTRATVVAGPLATLDLDLEAGMVVDSAYAGGAPTTFTRSGDLLTLNLDRAYAGGEPLEVAVRYHGLPLTGGTFGGAFGFSFANGRRLIWSLSEPYGARTWWPCKDAPEDKADSVDVRFTVPTGMLTASNGTLVSATDDGVVSTTRWHEGHPIATYLVSIASYPYAHSVDWYRPAPADSMRIDFFNFPETAGAVAPVQAEVKGMIAAFAARMGPYPFVDEKYGHAQFLFGGGMEHQTCTSLGSFQEYVVAHELSHQWWGDNVTCRNFHHIWLNEGFADYCEALWAEAGGGPAAYHADLAVKEYLGPGTVYVDDTTDVARIFDSNLTYDKGGWVLHMLRHVVGDTLFFQSLRHYREKFAYGTAVTDDFRIACEEVTGRDLRAFFQQWVYGEGHPVYRADWGATPGPPGAHVHLILHQTQGGTPFAMPVDLRITTASGDHTLVLLDSLTTQVFDLFVDGMPMALVVDPDHWILAERQPSLSAESPSAARVTLASAWPNPFAGGTTLRFELPRAGEAELDVIDASGRRVRALAGGRFGAGAHTVSWDGRDARGEPAAPGLYWARLRAEGAEVTTRMVRLR